MALISKEEMNRRKRMVASVIGTHAMEGITPEAETVALYRRYEEGDLTLEESGLAIDAHAGRLVAATRQMAGAA